MKFEVLGLGLWAGGMTDVSRLCEVTDREVEEALPRGESIEKRTRRRATPLSRAAADSFAQAVAAAGVNASEVPTIFCSALGETPAMIEQVDHVCRGVELSPMKFAVSVHSSSSTVVTISERNRKLTSSLSANYDTVAAGLFEMGALLGSEGGVGVVVFLDDHSPNQFLRPEERYGRSSVALVLRLWTPESRESRHGTVSVPFLDRARFGSYPAPQMSALLERSPVAGSLDLALALVGREPIVVPLDRGQGSGYCAVVDPGAVKPLVALEAEHA